MTYKALKRPQTYWI